MPEPMDDKTLQRYEAIAVAPWTELADPAGTYQLMIRHLVAEVQRLTADNATLRAEVGRLTAALEGQAEGRFIEGLREVAKAARYQIFLNFSEPQTPPTVVVQPTGTSLDLLEIFEEPTCTHPDGWSWEPEDWQPGPLARRVLGMLNRGEGESARPPERPQ